TVSRQSALGCICFRASAAVGPRPEPRLSLYALAVHRLALPASADMLRIWRRGDRAIRFVGGGMDDARTAHALSPARHVRTGFRTARTSGKFPLVSSLAIRKVARGQQERTRRRLILVHHPRRAERFQ